MGDFWTSHIRLKELGKGSYGSALLYRCKSSGKDYVVKEVDISRMSRKDAAIAEQEAKVPSTAHFLLLLHRWLPVPDHLRLLRVAMVGHQSHCLER